MTFLKHREIAEPGEIIPPVDEELFSAAKKGDAAKLRARLAAGIPADHPYGDESCVTPLIYAIRGGHHECMRILLEAGVDIHLIDGEKGHSPLRAAIHRNDPTAIQILLAFHADPGFKSVGQLPDGTRHACITDEELARRLCSEETAAAITATRTKFRVTEIAHENINCYEAIQGLLDTGVPVDIKNYNGQTALHYACLHKNYDMAKLLLDNGADTEIEWGHKGYTALRMACQPSINHQPNLPLVQLLITHGADMHKIDARGRSVAHTAAATADASLLKLIVANGVSLTGKDGEGHTPAQAAKEWSDKVDAAPVIEKILEVEEIGKKATRLDNAVKPMKKISLKF